MYPSSDIAKEIGSIVKRLRTAHNMTGVELANRAGFSQSAISKIENGYKLPERTHIEQLLNILDAPQIIRQQLVRLFARDSGNTTVNNLRSFDYISTKSAHRITVSVQHNRIFTVATLPFYVQTVDYRESLLKGLGLSAKATQAALADTQARQDLLWDTSKKFEILFTEMALYTRLTSVLTHLAQLDRVERMLSAGRLDIGIIPMEFGLTAKSACAFAVFDTKLVIREIGEDEIQSKDEAIIADHIRLFVALKQKALFGSEAIGLVSKAARYFDT